MFDHNIMILEEQYGDEFINKLYLYGDSLYCIPDFCERSIAGILYTYTYPKEVTKFKESVVHFDFFQDSNSILAVLTEDNNISVFGSKGFTPFILQEDPVVINSNIILTKISVVRKYYDDNDHIRVDIWAIDINNDIHTWNLDNGDIRKTDNKDFLKIYDVTNVVRGSNNYTIIIASGNAYRFYFHNNSIELLYEDVKMLHLNEFTKDLMLLTSDNELKVGKLDIDRNEINFNNFNLSVDNLARKMFPHINFCYHKNGKLYNNDVIITIPEKYICDAFYSGSNFSIHLATEDMCLYMYDLIDRYPEKLHQICYSSGLPVKLATYKYNNSRYQKIKSARN